MHPLLLYHIYIFSQTLIWKTEAWSTTAISRIFLLLKIKENAFSRNLPFVFVFSKEALFPEVQLVNFF